MKRFASLTAMLTLGAVPAAALADRPGPHHSFPIVREGTAGLADHTVFRPADPDAPGFKLPIVGWANGGCRNSNEEFRYFLTHFAPYGYFIVANGDPAHPYNPEELDGLADPKPEKLIAGIDWAVAQNADPASLWYGRLDADRIALMGQSCGGGEAIDASEDARVRSTIAWNEGLHTNAGGLHAPILIVSGGSSDFTYPMQEAAYAGVPEGVPAVRADHADAGHTGFWDDPSDGSPPPGPYQEEPLVVAQRWLELTLYGQPPARDFFLGACDLCRRPGWTVASKNWEGFSLVPTEAPPVAADPPAPAPAPEPACATGRPRAITVRVPRRFRVRAARLRVGRSWRRVPFARAGRRVRVPVRLGRRRSEPVVVKVVLSDARGRTVRAKRRIKCVEGER